MKKQTASLILIILFIVAAAAGGLYFFEIQSATSAPSPSPTITSTPTPAATATPTPTPTSNPATTTAPTTESWTITKVTEAESKTSLTSSTFGKTYNPKSTDNVFLYVGFGLKTTVEGGTLDIQRILVVVDGIHSFGPVGDGQPNGAVGDLMLGNITDEPKFYGFTATFEFVDLDTSKVDSYSTFFSNSYASPVELVFLLPKAYLDGTHPLELKVAGSIEGVEFTIKQP